jgi:hypothetical protein
MIGASFIRKPVKAHINLGDKEALIRIRPCKTGA